MMPKLFVVYNNRIYIMCVEYYVFKLDLDIHFSKICVCVPQNLYIILIATCLLLCCIPARTIEDWDKSLSQ